MRKPLVGIVDERYEAAFDQERCDVAPLVRRQAGAGRIVAAGVNEDGIAGLRARKRRHHGVELVRLCGNVEKRIGLDVETGCGKNAEVILPARHADPDPALARGPQQFGGKTQCAGPARGLDACHEP